MVIDAMDATSGRRLKEWTMAERVAWKKVDGGKTHKGKV